LRVGVTTIIYDNDVANEDLIALIYLGNLPAIKLADILLWEPVLHRRSMYSIYKGLLDKMPPWEVEGKPTRIRNDVRLTPGKNTAPCADKTLPFFLNFVVFVCQFLYNWDELFLQRLS
jgi:hypothetical protein